MLDRASSTGTVRPVQWQQADDTQLPFGDGMFDAVICHFGMMFMPDKSKAFAEPRRVLRIGGVLLFNVRHRIEDNEFPHTVAAPLAPLFPCNPPRVLCPNPHR